MRDLLSSPWFIANAVVFALILVNGTIAYIFKSRRMRRLGQEPPPFLKYLFFPTPFPADVKVPRLVRLALGLVVLAGGVFFVLVGGLLLYDKMRGLSLLGLLVLVFFIGLGLAIVYVGFRLLVVKNDEPLFGRGKSSV